MKNELELKPTYWASVSGGKDSLFMLKLILKHPEKYPLNGVVYFDLEIDYPFIKDVISKIKAECIKLKIPMFEIKPRRTWIELYEKHNFPTRVTRWCNSKYKLDCSKQFEELQNKYGNNVNWYIGYCFDEKNRYKKRTNENEFYPLVDYEIEEKYILEWARKQKIYNNYYLTNDRCGCKWCPMSSMINFAYLYKYYPNDFNKMIELMLDTETKLEKRYGVHKSAYNSNSKYDANYLNNIIKTKWLKKLNELEIQRSVEPWKPNTLT